MEPTDREKKIQEAKEAIRRAAAQGETRDEVVNDLKEIRQDINVLIVHAEYGESE